MFDVCLVCEGGWPRRTGGLSTWAQHFTTALGSADIAVVSFETTGASGGEFDVPRGVRRVDSIGPHGAAHTKLTRASLPEARRYVASGLDAADAALRAFPQLERRLIYVEHGDAVREVLAGASESESGSALGAASPSSRREAARAIATKRRAVASACEIVVGVTPRTARRLGRELHRDTRPEVRTIPNAVPPPSVTPRDDGPERRARERPVAAFVGRFSRIKGIDRFLALAERTRARCAAIGLPSIDFAEPGRPPANVDIVRGQGDPFATVIDAIALPSRLEACPFVALEAEARGLRALVSDAAALEESELVSTLPWDPKTWGAALDDLTVRGRDETLGREIAERRWAAFVRAVAGLV